jgi:hypothetical protein
VSLRMKPAVVLCCVGFAFSVLFVLCFLFLFAADVSLTIQCEIPSPVGLMSYGYQVIDVPSLDEAQLLVESHFPESEIASSQTSKDNFTYVFRDSAGRQVMVFRDGWITLDILDPDKRVPVDHEFDLEKLETEARSFLDLHDVNCSKLYLLRVMQSVQYGENTAPQQTGPIFIFGLLYDAIPIVPIGIPSGAIVSFDPDGNVARASFARISICRVGEEVSVLPLEECLRRSRGNISRLKDVSDTVIGAKVGYYGSGGKLFPCWWVEVAAEGSGSIKTLVVDAVYWGFPRPCDQIRIFVFVC